MYNNNDNDNNNNNNNSNNNNNNKVQRRCTITQRMPSQTNFDY